MKELMKKIITFRDERNWEPFHTPNNLVKSLAIEAAELLEVFQWNTEGESIERVKEELADVFIYGLLINHHYGFDLESIIEEKLHKNNLKYPVAKSKGNAKKYTELKKVEDDGN